MIVTHVIYAFYLFSRRFTLWFVIWCVFLYVPVLFQQLTLRMFSQHIDNVNWIKLNSFFILKPGGDRNIQAYLFTSVFKNNLILITGI